MREFEPDIAPVLGFSGQPLPTTSNVNYLRAELAAFLDMEGEDGGLPLTQVYTGAHDVAVGSGELDTRVEVDDALRATRAVMSTCDQKQLERYMEARRNATRDALPRLAYTLGDVVVYVEAADSFESAADVAKLFARVSLFASSCADAVVSAFPPALIVVQSQCAVRSGSSVVGAVASPAAVAAAAALGTVDFDIESSSAALRALDTQRQLADVFASVHVVRIPDWVRAELYAEQVGKFKALVASLAEQSVAQRAERGLRLTERGWFDVAADVVRSWNTPSLAVAQFLQRHNHVAADVDARIAARAYEFFHRIYHTPELGWYVKCRTAAVRLCAVECIAAVAEDECSALDASLFNRAFELLAARIDARAPCQFSLDAARCGDERMTHGGVHRLEQNESRIEDAFRFIDNESPDDRRRVFTDTLRTVSKATRRSSAIASQRSSQHPDRSAALLAQRLAIYRDVVTGDAASPLEDPTCWLCFRHRPSVLLACTHSVCKQCYWDMRQRGTSGSDTVDCPVCGVAAAALASQPNSPGRSGLRVLALDGATLKGALGAVGQLRQLEQLTGLRVADLFDVIGGASYGGVLAIVFGVCGASAAVAAGLIEQLLGAGASRPAALMLEYPLEQPFGADGDVWLPASKFDQLLRAATHDDAIGWSELHDSAAKNSRPKVFAATTESGVDGVYLFANYAQGERATPTVDCLSLTAWEAARACSAVLDAYENNARVFVDAALGGLPPAEALAADEAVHLTDYARRIEVFVSIDAQLPADAVAQFRSGSVLRAPFGAVDAVRAMPGVYTALSSSNLSGSGSSSAMPAPSTVAPSPSRSKSHLNDDAPAPRKARPADMRKEKSTTALPDALRKEKSSSLLPVPHSSGETHGTGRKKRSHKSSSSSGGASAMRTLAQRLLALTYRAERQGAFETMCGVRSSFLVRCSVAHLRAAKVEVCAWLVVAGDEAAAQPMNVVECALPADMALSEGANGSDAIVAPAFEVDYVTNASGLHRVVVKMRLLGGSASNVDDETRAADALAADGTDGWWNVSGSPFVLSVSESETSAGPLASAALLDLFELAQRVECASNVAVARKLEAASKPSDDEMLLLSESARRAATRLAMLKLAVPSALESLTPKDWLAWRDDHLSLYRACAVQLGIGCSDASDDETLARTIDFVRRRAVTWMTQHADVRCGGVHTLRALVEQRSDSRWNEYVSRVAGADVRGDMFVLFAIAESFGTPLLVITGAGVKGESFLLWHEPQAKLSSDPIALVHWSDGDFAPLVLADRVALARVADVRSHLLKVAFADEFASEAALRRARQQRRQAALEGAVEAVDKAVEIAAHLRNAALLEVADNSPRRADGSPSSLRSPLAKGRTLRDDTSVESANDAPLNSSRHRARRTSGDNATPASPVVEAPESPHRPTHRRPRGADESGSGKRNSLRHEGKRRNSSLRSDSSRNDSDELGSTLGAVATSSRSNELISDDSESGTGRPRARRSRNSSGSSDRAATLAPDGSLRAVSTGAGSGTVASSSPPESPAKRRGGREVAAPLDSEAHGKARVMSALRALPTMTTESLRSSGGLADISQQQLTVLPAALTPLAPMIYALDASHNELVSISGTSIHTSSGSSTGSPRETSEDSSAVASLRRSPTRSTSPRLRAAMQCGATLLQFTGLRSLVLAHNRLTSLPGTMFDALQALEVLDLSHNRLASLPASIGDLAALRHLMLAHNALDHLAPQIVNLDALRLLDVSFNKLTLVPAFIADLESLQVLRTEGNPFRSHELRSLFACQTDVIVNFLEANKRALRKMHRNSSSSKGLVLPDRSAAVSPESASGLGTSSRISVLSTDIGDLLRSDTSGGTTSGGATSPSSPLSRSAKVSRVTADEMVPTSTLQRAVSSHSATSDDNSMAGMSPIKAMSSIAVMSPTNKQVTLVRGITGRRNSLSRSMASMLNMLPTGGDADKDSAAAAEKSAAPASPVALLRGEKSARRLSVDSLKLAIPLDPEEAHAAAAEVASAEAQAAAAQLAVINSELLHYNLPRDTSSQGPATPKGQRVGRRGSRRMSALEMSQALAGSGGAGGGGGGGSGSGGSGSGGSALRRKLLDSEHRAATNASVLQALTDDNDGGDNDEAAVLEEGRLVPLADFDMYFDCEHVSFLGTDSGGRAIVLSAVRERTSHAPTYRALLRTEDGDERLWLPADMIKVDGKHKLARPKDLLAAATRLRPDLLQNAQLKAYKDARVPAELLTFETTLRMKGYKFGVVYAKDGQSTEDDALANPSGSERFDEFLKLLGETITLQGWQHYRAGLDVANGSTGTQSVYTMFQDCEVMFHVATMLPLQPCKAGEQVQQLARKRHIGNDIVVIVFQDGTTPFDVSSVASEFNHVWFVVQPLKMAGKTHYRLAIACKNGVGEFGPSFSQSVFASGATFRSFLLAKLINAERAAYQAPGFAKPIRRSRQMLLDALLETVRSISKSTDKPRQAVGFERDE
jgi:RAP1 GTPase activating protein 1